MRSHHTGTSDRIFLLTFYHEVGDIDLPGSIVGTEIRHASCKSGFYSITSPITATLPPEKPIYSKTLYATPNRSPFARTWNYPNNTQLSCPVRNTPLAFSRCGVTDVWICVIGHPMTPDSGWGGTGEFYYDIKRCSGLSPPKKWNEYEWNHTHSWIHSARQKLTVPLRFQTVHKVGPPTISYRCIPFENSYPNIYTSEFSDLRIFRTNCRKRITSGLQANYNTMSLTSKCGLRQTEYM